MLFPHRALYPDKVNDLEQFRHHLESSSEELKPLKVWQFQELSLQAAEKIMSESQVEALATLIHIAQNFPKQVSNFLVTYTYICAPQTVALIYCFVWSDPIPSQYTGETRT